jgi:amino acid permease
MIGFEAVSITAPENRNLREKENIKLASRKISLRIILLYTLSVFAVGLNVPYNDPNLQDFAINAVESGEHSIFIIAAVRDGVLGFPHFFNGFFIFSATSAGINALYISSRLLHALAVCPDV